jgi:GAF domain-containing protein
VTTAAASDENVETIDAIQYETDEGPCLQAIRDGQIFRIDSMSGDTRWPRFAARAAGLGVQTCLALPLIEDGSSFGALGLYSYANHVFSSNDEKAAVVLAAQASGPLANMRRYAQLTQIASRLLESTDSKVALAAGILMERDGCSSADAMKTLRRIAEFDGGQLEGASLSVIGSVNIASFSSE